MTPKNAEELFESRKPHKGVVPTAWSGLFHDYRDGWEQRFRELEWKQEKDKARREGKVLRFKGPAQPPRPLNRARVERRARLRFLAAVQKAYKRAGK